MKNVFGDSILVPQFRTPTPGYALSQLGKYKRYGFTQKQVLANSVKTTFMGIPITFHRLHYAQLKAVERDLLGYAKKIKNPYKITSVFTFYWRMIKKLFKGHIIFGKTRSNHSWNIAVDVNAPANGLGTKGNMTSYVIKSFHAHGFRWGGRFSTPDPMHYEA